MGIKKSTPKKTVYKIFISHQNGVPEVLDKNHKISPITPLAMCSYQGNKVAILFSTLVDQKPLSVKDGAETKCELIYGSPKKCMVELNKYHVENIVGFTSTQKYINILFVGTRLNDEDEQ